MARFSVGLVVLSTLALISTVFAAASSSIPLDAVTTFARGAAGSKVIVDLFIDLICSDCQSQWPTLTQVFETYQEEVSVCETLRRD